MRMMLKISIPVAAGNAAVRDGSLGKKIQSMVADIKPEAAYFSDFDGKRTGYIFFEMKDSSQIPAIAEPWFLAFNAEVEFKPVMNGADLAKAQSGIDRAVKKYR
jgi:hypothetical protein